MTRNIPLEMGWDALILADQARGLRRTAQASRSRRSRPQRDRIRSTLYFDLIAARSGSARIVNVGYGGDLEDDRPLRRLVARPDAIPETDTVPVAEARAACTLPLPLFYGTMARFLGHFSRDLELIPLEEAVRRITPLPAERAQLARIGACCATGAFARSSVVFDPDDDRRPAGHCSSPKPPSGIVHVFVNGEPVVEDGVYDPSANAGRALRVQRVARR